MRLKEEICRDFAETDPANVKSEDSLKLSRDYYPYQRDKLMLEVLLDIRELLNKNFLRRE